MSRRTCDGGRRWRWRSGTLAAFLSAHVVVFWWLQVLVALACDLELDTLPCCAETHKWAWFRRYCMASRVVVALDRRTPLPRAFLDEVLCRFGFLYDAQMSSLLSCSVRHAHVMWQRHFPCQEVP